MNFSPKTNFASRLSLVVSWKESLFAEVDVGAIGPEACVGAGVVECALNGTRKVSLTSQLAQVVLNVEALLAFEESKSLEDATDVAGSWCFGLENLVAIVSE